MIEADIQFFKEYISRLTHELLLCQGKSDLDVSKYEFKVELPSCLLSEKVMSPLFYAYDMRIEELRSVIESQGTYLDLITQRMRYLLDENEDFRNKQSASLRNLRSEPLKQDSPAAIKENQSQGENELLLQQSDLLVEELRNVNDALINREKSIIGLSLDLEKKAALIDQYERKSELLEQRLKNTEYELSRERCSVDTLKQQLDELLSSDSQKAAVLHATLAENKECKVDVADWSQRIIASISSIQALQEQDIRNKKEIHSLSDKIVQYEDNLRSCESKCTVLQRSLIFKDDQLEVCKKMIDDCQKDKASLHLKAKESQMEHEKANAICIALQEKIDRLLDNQLESVSQRKADIKLVIDALEENQVELGNDNHIMELNKQIVNLEIQLDRLTRENDLNNAVNTKLRSDLDKERDSFGATLAELSTSLNKISAKLAQEEGIRAGIERSKKEAESKLRLIEEKFTALSNELSQEKGRRSNDKDAHNRAFKSMEERLNAAIDNMSKHCKQVEADNVILARKLNESHTHRCDEIFLLELKLEEAEKTIKHLTAEVENQDKSHRDSLMDTLNEKKIIIDELERSLENSLDMQKKLSEEMKAMMQSCAQLTSDKLIQRKVVEEKDRKISEISAQLSLTQQKLAIISKQLSDNVEEQKDRIQIEYSLKAEIQKMKIKSPLMK